MLSVRGVYQKGEVRLDQEIITDREVPVIVTFLEERLKTRPSYGKYRFLDLAGKLEWQGDAVAEQRAIRDEWPE